MRDQDPTVRSSLHGAEDASSGRCARETNVQETFEGAPLFAFDFYRFRQFVFSVGFFDAGKVLGQVELREGPSGDEESRSVGGGPVGEAVLNAVALEFVRICGAEYLVARDFRRHDLDDNVPVGEAHHEAVFGRIVFVLGLGDEAFTSVVVGFALAAALVFGLVAASRLLG